MKLAILNMDRFVTKIIEICQKMDLAFVNSSFLSGRSRIDLTVLGWGLGQKLVESDQGSSDFLHHI